MEKEFFITASASGGFDSEGARFAIPVDGSENLSDVFKHVLEIVIPEAQKIGIPMRQINKDGVTGEGYKISISIEEIVKVDPPK